MAVGGGVGISIGAAPGEAELKARALALALAIAIDRAAGSIVFKTLLKNESLVLLQVQLKPTRTRIHKLRAQ